MLSHYTNKITQVMSHYTNTLTQVTSHYTNTLTQVLSHYTNTLTQVVTLHQHTNTGYVTLHQHSNTGCVTQQNITSIQCHIIHSARKVSQCAEKFPSVQKLSYHSLPSQVRPAQPSMRCGQLRQNFLCMRTTWNSIYKMKNEQAYVLLWTQFHLCVFLYIMSHKNTLKLTEIIN